jgi:phospholipid/cholesterol/gamma-HCH transport system ATP-binding protein
MKPNAASEKVIEVANLVTHYGKRKILDGIDFDVRAGEIMVVMGGSGSGKSTLMRHLLSLEQATSGTIRILGKDISKLDTVGRGELHKELGVAFQTGALFSSLTVGENIMLPLTEHTRLDRQTMEIMMRMKLEVVDLAGFEDLMPAELSGGMVKRAALARAVVMDPQILFCDEPSAGLDPVVSAAIDDLLLRLRDALHMSIVVITHELESAFKIADRITILDHGKVLLVGSVEEVKASKNERIQNILHRRNEEEILDLDAYLERLTGIDVRPGIEL